MTPCLVAALVAVSSFSLGGQALAGLPPVAGPTSFPSDDAFLDYVQRQTFNFFWNEANTNNGLIRDRSTVNSPCSIASIGFGLSALNVAIERGWITREQGRARVLLTLQTLINSPQGTGTTNVCGYRGWFYHFLDLNTGLRYGSTELSTVDTALLMLGVIDAGLFFQEPTNTTEILIRQLADQLVNRVDWPFMLRTNDFALAMQWTPEAGFSAGGWVGYSEASCMYLLGLGAATNPLPAASWKAWTSGYSWITAYGQSFVACPPLFTHQYSQTWIDYRFIADAYFRAKGSDYFENSRRATLAQQQYAIRNPLRFPNYGYLEWGLTACDGPNKTVNGTVYFGYAARGAPDGLDDGTLAPTAVVGSLPFAPEICLPTARLLYDSHLTNIWTFEGFRDAFNLQVNWWDGDTIGIDEGPIVLMIENYRTGSVWQRMMRSPILQRGLAGAGFTAPPPEQTLATAIATNQIQVSWSGPPSYQTGFQILTSLDGVNFGLAAATGPSESTVVLPAQPNTTYYIRVISTNAAGLSQPRQTVSVITPTTMPLPVVTLMDSDAPDTSSFAVPGHWSDGVSPSDAHDYQVNGVASGGGGYTLRTPDDSLSRAFGGNSLTIGNGVSHSPPNQLLLVGMNATNSFIDLRLNGGTVSLNSGGTRHTLAGTLSLQNAGATFEQGAFNDRYLRVAATLQGGGPVTVSQAANGPVSASPSVDGCVEFSGMNTYLGATFVTGSGLSGDLITQTGPATLRVGNLQNGGLASDLGKSSAAAANLVLNAGFLQYSGPGSTSDRLFTMGQLGAGLEASGTGALNLTNRGALGLSGVGSRMLMLSGTNSANNTLSAAIGDNGGPTTLLKTNSGTWVLAGTNSYSGLAILGGGTLVLNGSHALGSTQAVLLNAGTLVFSNANASSPIIANGGNLKFSGPDATNSIRGQITITAPTLNINGLTVGAPNATLLLAGGVIGTNRNLELFDDLNDDPGRIWIVGKPINLGSGELQGFGAHIAVAGNLVGTIHPYYGRRFTLETNNVFTGAPALYLGNPSWGRMDLNGHSLIVSRLTNTLSADEITSTSPATLMVANSAPSFYSGKLTGSGLALTKTASGTLTLSGTNAYGGPTTLISGTLALSALPGLTAVLPNSPVLSIAKGTVFDVSGVASGFTLAPGQTLKGSGTVGGALSVGAGATLAPGDPNVATINSLLCKNLLTLLPGSTTVVHVTTSSQTNDVINALGGVSLDGTLVVKNIGSSPFSAGDSFTLFTAPGISGRFNSIVPATPGPDLVWDTTGLTNSGTLRIALALHINSLELSGTNLILSGEGGKSNAMFYVLGSSNISVPFSQWQRIATDYFNASGSFIVTNANVLGPPRAFFGLEAP